VTKIVIAKIRSGAPKRGKRPAVRKLVREPGGRRATVYTVDSTSKTFDGDLLRAFQSNIDAARKANTVIFGSPDGPET
jgi:hypothetical protein